MIVQQSDAARVVGWNEYTAVQKNIVAGVVGCATDEVGQGVEWRAQTPVAVAARRVVHEPNHAADYDAHRCHIGGRHSGASYAVSVGKGVSKLVHSFEARVGHVGKTAVSGIEQYLAVRWVGRHGNGCAAEGVVEVVGFHPATCRHIDTDVANAVIRSIRYRQRRRTEGIGHKSRARVRGNAQLGAGSIGPAGILDGDLVADAVVGVGLARGTVVNDDLVGLGGRGNGLRANWSGKKAKNQRRQPCAQGFPAYEWVQLIHSNQICRKNISQVND